MRKFRLAVGTPSMADPLTKGRRGVTIESPLMTIRDREVGPLNSARRLLSGLLRFVGTVLGTLSRSVHQSPQAKRVVPWFRARGDQTLRLDYDLGPESIVLDLGGYEGQWSSDIFARYCCVIHVFEPVADFAEGIRRRFERNERLFVHPFGLAEESSDSVQLSVDGDASSAFTTGTNSETIKLVRASDFFQERKIEWVDLMKINIEGGEYALLEHLIDTGLIRKVKNIQVQFHDFVPDAEARMAGIQRELEKTHFLTYQYPFVWENWSLR